MKSLGRGGRLLVAVAVAGAAFGIATVVQAAIPDSNGVVHGCYVPYGTGNTTLMTYLRLIDTEPAGPMANKGKSCITGEVPVDLASTGYVATHANKERQGIVYYDGSLIYSSGFTVTHTAGTGIYVITFPAGTFNFDATNFPTMTITSFSGVPIHDPATYAATLFGNGSLVYGVTTGATEGYFSFVVNQHNGPNLPGNAPADAKITLPAQH